MWLGPCKSKLTSKAECPKIPFSEKWIGKSKEITGSTLNPLSGNTQLEKWSRPLINLSLKCKPWRVCCLVCLCDRFRSNYVKLLAHYESQTPLLWSPIKNSSALPHIVGQKAQRTLTVLIHFSVFWLQCFLVEFCCSLIECALLLPPIVFIYVFFLLCFCCVPLIWASPWVVCFFAISLVWLQLTKLSLTRNVKVQTNRDQSVCISDAENSQWQT